MQPWTETRTRNERAADLLVDRGYQEAITYASRSRRAGGAVPGAGARSWRIRSPRSWRHARCRCGRACCRRCGRISADSSSACACSKSAALRRRRRRRDRSRSPASSPGSALPEQWGSEATKVDFFDVKADVEALLALTGASGPIPLRGRKHPALHPGQSARIYRGDRPIGWLGALHPEHSRAPGFDISGMSCSSSRRGPASVVIIPVYAEISRYPAIRRDLAVDRR